MADRCRWEHDEEIGPWHLPGCWGAIIGGPEGCICEFEDPDTLEGKLQRMEHRISELEETVRRLTGDGE